MPGYALTSARILDAALEVASERGLARLTLDDVAARAVVSRQTIYRHFGRREALVTQVIMREETVVLERVRRMLDDAPTLGRAIEDAVVNLYSEARAHPLLDRLLREEPEAILPYLVPTETPVLGAALVVVDELLQRFAPHVPEPPRHRLGGMVTRLCLSYVVSPPDDDIRMLAAELAAMVVHSAGQTTTTSQRGGTCRG